MPDPSSDDPFADLFGKLPDPRSRQLRSSSEDSASGSGANAGGAPTSSLADTGGVPLSRRAAREAAAQQSATAADAAAPPPPVPPLPATAPPAGTSAAAAAAAQHETAPIQVDPHDEPWLFAGAEAAPAMPYGRGAASRENGPEAQRTDSLESLFAGHASTDDFGHLPPPKNKRKRRIGGWIALGIVLLLIGGVVSGGIWVWNTYEDKIREVMGWEEPKDYADGEANGEAYVTVAEGDTGSPISQSLYDAGITKTPGAFYDYLIETQQNPPFVPGVFKMQKQMTSEAALAALLDPANKMENTAQLREGLTVDASLPILAEATGLPVEDFQAAVANPADYGVAADSLEGWLFPATYTFDPGVTAPQVIQTLVDRAVKSLDQAEVPVEDRPRILTIASIIQREARFEDDFYKVSRVIQNRLDPDNQETFGLLQMDSTAQYGYGELHDGTVSSSEEALNDDNPWNTYLHTGLPIGPISNPGDTAIDAAMHPADGDWLYFVTVNLDTGETVFTSNLADHERARAQWIAWCADHPDSGC
ncbi:endolytic transglycosylase MltG [Microbacterium pumilum]|uniref:Endolytic murein transglycosylase n=1 Tax=Microbacterium pumilum TaxID=344165 RepID=A0ABN2SLF8_9MICO